MDAAHAGSRLDAFLTGHLHAQSRSRIKVLVEAGHVTVDGAPAKPALRVRRGQRIEVVVPPPPPVGVTPEAIPLDVVYEDAHLLVVNKPPRLTVHPGAGRSSGTLANAIVARVPHLAGVGGAQRPGIVHRLDKDTSGLLVVAKTSQAYQSLQSQVAARAAGRTYLALVCGVVPDDEGIVSAPIGRHPRHRTKMAVVPRGRTAITRYRVLERFARHTLIEAELVTGRTHQIRVHFAHLGHPVAGDPVYGARPDELGVGRQALHAFRLRFAHPVSGAEMTFEAPLPLDLAAAVQRARAQGATPSRRKGRRR